jgi:serine acetyltransferase
MIKSIADNSFSTDTFRHQAPEIESELKTWQKRTSLQIWCRLNHWLPQREFSPQRLLLQSIIAWTTSSAISINQHFVKNRESLRAEGLNLAIVPLINFDHICF